MISAFSMVFLVQCPSACRFNKLIHHIIIFTDDFEVLREVFQRVANAVNNDGIGEERRQERDNLFLLRRRGEEHVKKTICRGYELYLHQLMQIVIIMMNHFNAYFEGREEEVCFRHSSSHIPSLPKWSIHTASCPLHFLPLSFSSFSSQSNYRPPIHDLH